MILVFLVISIALFILNIYLTTEVEDNWIFAFFITLPILAICVITTIGLTNSVVKLQVIDEQIEMYAQENNKIEQQIETTVKTYQEHEKEVFENVKGDSYIQLVTLYPELKSDELVKTQIETYQTNNEMIKELKEKAINGKIKRWWLYFGKIKGDKQ